MLPSYRTLALELAMCPQAGHMYDSRTCACAERLTVEVSS
jgi:hypothetical protein